MRTLEIQVEDPAAAGPGVAEDGWRFSALALSPRRLKLAGRDARWHTSWLVATMSGTIAGILPVYRPKQAASTDSSYDLHAVAPELAAAVPADARNWLLIGGCKDLVAGALISGQADDSMAAHIRQRLAEAAFALAAAENRTPLALYVRGEDEPAFISAAGPGALAIPVTEEAYFDITFSDVYGMLARLRSKNRSTVRRDLRKIGALGLHASEVPAASVIGEAAPLIVMVKEKYGIADHPRIAAMRLREWLGSERADYVAFTVRDETGELLGVQFACHYSNILEAHEIGLRQGLPAGHYIYAEILFYAPLRYAWREGCRTVRLGLDSIPPKRERGALIRPVWAIGRPS